MSQPPSPSPSRFDWGSALELALVLAGVAFVGLLFVDTYRQPAVPMTFSLDAGVAGVEESWSGLYVGDEKIGYSVHREAPRDDGGLILQERTHLQILLLGAPNEISLANDVYLSPRGTVESLRSQVRTEVKGVPVTLRAEGRSTGAGMELDLFQAGAKLTTLSLDEVPATSATLYRAITSQPRAAGDTLSLPFFNPLSLGSSEAKVKVVGKEDARTPDGDTVAALRVQVDNNGQLLNVLLSEDGRRLSETEVGGLGMRVLWESQDDALNAGWPADREDAVDLIALSSIPVDRRLPGGGRDVTQLRLRVQGPDAVDELLARFHGDDWDQVGKVLTLRRDDLSGPSYQLPSQERALEPWLRSTAFIQSDDEAVVRAAGKILQDRLEAADAAVALGTWVFREVEKLPVAGVPSAREVLSSMRGDCNEHTTLYTALARSVGLPTRLAAGIVYSESVFADGAFYYHAWPEVWLGDRWVAIDPTFGQAPADATHVKLVEGELDKQTELMAVIGRLRISVLDVEESP